MSIAYELGGGYPLLSWMSRSIFLTAASSSDLTFAPATMLETATWNAVVMVG